MTNAGRFQLLGHGVGLYGFKLRAANGETILLGGNFGTKAEAEKGILKVRLAAAEEQNYVRLETATGFAFVLRGFHGESLGTSEVYASAINRDQGIQVVKRIAPLAVTQDLTWG